jgi:hypothetical protein
LIGVSNNVGSTLRYDEEGSDDEEDQTIDEREDVDHDAGRLVRSYLGVVKCQRRMIVSMKMMVMSMRVDDDWDAVAMMVSSKAMTLIKVTPYYRPTVKLSSYSLSRLNNEVDAQLRKDDGIGQGINDEVEYYDDYDDQ